MYCRYCGGENLTYQGIDDGCGDYGTAIADLYECCDCGNVIEVVSFDMLDYPDEMETEVPSLSDDDLNGIPF